MIRENCITILKVMQSLHKMPVMEMKESEFVPRINFFKQTYNCGTHGVAIFYNIFPGGNTIVITDSVYPRSGIVPRVKKCNSCCCFTSVSARFVAAFASPPPHSAYIDPQQKKAILSDSTTAPPIFHCRNQVMSFQKRCNTFCKAPIFEYIRNPAGDEPKKQLVYRKFPRKS